jgi:dephospho-CoA kinase
MYRTNGSSSKIVYVGLVGYPGSGRTIIANFLRYTFGFTKFCVLDKVKEISNVLDKMDMTSLQEIKHVLRKTLGEKIWINLLERSIQEAMVTRLVETYFVPGVTEIQSVFKVVIGDIEYQNEFDYIKEKQGLLIGLRGSEETLHERGKETLDAPSFEEFQRFLKHPSFNEIPSLVKRCDFIMDVDQTPIPMIEEKIERIVKKYFITEIT